MNDCRFQVRCGEVRYERLFSVVVAFEPAAGPSAENAYAPLNYFLHSFGPASLPILHLGWVFVGLLTVIFLTVLVLLLVAVFRNRAPQTPAAQADETQGMPWVYFGTGLSTCILLALAVYSLTTLNSIAKPSQAPALTLTVTGYDWWWKVEYENEDPNLQFVTANEIHIPVGQPVLIKLKSADVIHAFWVPTLAGKTQMIPGLANQQWLQADAEGIYRGQCAQYCGVQHAHMSFEVVAQSAADFRKWQASQHNGAAKNAVEDSSGKTVFLEHCAACHAIRGTGATGSHGPDLTHLKSRRLIAGGLLSNTPEHLQEWIAYAQDLKPGNRMPSMALTEAELSALSVFLSALE